MPVSQWARRRQCRHILRGEKWFALEQRDVTPHTEPGIEACYADGFIEPASGCHQRRRGHDAATVRVLYGAIDAGGHAEVIGIHDQPFHAPSLNPANAGMLIR